MDATLSTLLTSVLNVLSQAFFDGELIELATPAALWILLIWPLLWLMSGVSAFFGALHEGVEDDLTQLRSQRQLVVKHALIHKMDSGSATKAPVKRRFSLVDFGVRFGLNLLRGLIIITLAIALAQPEKVQTLAPLPQQKTVRDIVFVIESSASFLLPDYQVEGRTETRMSVVKMVLDQFVSGLEGNRFGLAIYAEQAYTLMPLTADQTATRLNLQRLKPYLAGRTDEAMGEALGLALKQTESASKNGLNGLDAQKSGDPIKRVVVLISDGLSQPSRLPLSEAINYAQLLQVPIYTIGVGASNQSADTRIYTGLLYQPLESDSLKAIAAETQGQYFEVGSGQDLSQVLQKINEAEGVPFETEPRPPQRIGLYYLPLTIAVFGLFIYLLLTFLWSSRVQRSKPAVTQAHKVDA